MTQTSKPLSEPAPPGPASAGSDPISVLEQQFRILSMNLIRHKQHSNDNRLDRLALMILGTLTHCGPSRLSTVAERCGFDPSTASRQVADLEKVGLLERTTDPDDRRAVLLKATRKGQQLLQRLEIGRRKRIERILTGWTEAEIDTFGHLLARLNEASEKYYEQNAREVEQELNHG